MTSHGAESDLSLLEAAEILKRLNTFVVNAIEKYLTGGVAGTAEDSASGTTPNLDGDSAPQLSYGETTPNQPIPTPINQPNQGQAVSVIKRSFTAKEPVPVEQRKSTPACRQIRFTNLNEAISS